ncbi:MAG: Lrp/AsnC ligand binding domain-containing protein [Candidatus Bathyarchaeota archaeon]|jgi:DNA-binding Lrp family transcriptional regulator
MPTAFVMINTELGSEKEVLDQIRKIDEVTESCIVYGIHDIAVKIRAKTMDEIDDIVTWVRNLDKIQGTVTLILIEGEK